MKNIKRKTYAVVIALYLLLAAATVSIYNITHEPLYANAVLDQSGYTLNVYTKRGMIYDCNMNPLVDENKKYVAAVAPTIETIGYLSTICDKSEREYLASMLESGKPFIMELDEPVEFDGIDVFEVANRYSGNQLAANLIGYLDSEGNGVTGIERSMNGVLKGRHGEITVDYRVDAMGRVIAGDSHIVNDSTYGSSSGAVLTIDSNIQGFAEKAAEKLHKGAVVVTEVGNCEVRAMVSTPSYSPTDLAASAESEDSPFVNRTLTEYSPGSIFKLVVAAAQIESGNGGLVYECTGSTDVGGMSFSCYAGNAHGIVDLEQAVAKSCNCYFINSAKNIGAENILAMAYNMGLGASTELGMDFVSASGNLPSAKELQNARAFANFSFGQGSLTVTPIQAAAVINTIASGGIYTEAKVISGLVDDDYRFTSSKSLLDTKMRVMDRSTAAALQKYMETATLSGTAAPGSPYGCVSGAKTGTAQTGVFENGEELNNFWYTGYVGSEGSPSYCITVMSEAVADDEGKTAQVFKEIAEYISSEIL